MAHYRHKSSRKLLAHNSGHLRRMFSRKCPITLKQYPSSTVCQIGINWWWAKQRKSKKAISGNFLVLTIYFQRVTQRQASIGGAVLPRISEPDQCLYTLTWAVYSFASILLSLPFYIGNMLKLVHSYTGYKEFHFVNRMHTFCFL